MSESSREPAALPSRPRSRCPAGSIPCSLFLSADRAPLGRACNGPFSDRSRPSRGTLAMVVQYGLEGRRSSSCRPMVTSGFAGVRVPLDELGLTPGALSRWRGSRPWLPRESIMAAMVVIAVLFEGKVFQATGQSAYSQVLTNLVAASPSALSEEVLFRGLILPGAGRKVGPWKGQPRDRTPVCGDPLTPLALDARNEQRRPHGDAGGDDPRGLPLLVADPDTVALAKRRRPRRE